MLSIDVHTSKPIVLGAGTYLLGSFVDVTLTGRHVVVRGQGSHLTMFTRQPGTFTPRNMIRIYDPASFTWEDIGMDWAGMTSGDGIQLTVGRSSPAVSSVISPVVVRRSAFLNSGVADATAHPHGALAIAAARDIWITDSVVYQAGQVGAGRSCTDVHITDNVVTEVSENEA